VHHRQLRRRHGLHGRRSTGQVRLMADHAATVAPRGAVGLIGIGAMGRGFARNLLEAGFTVRGYDLERARMAEFSGWGGFATGSPAEAASGTSWVLTSLPKHQHVV